MVMRDDAAMHPGVVCVAVVGAGRPERDCGAARKERRECDRKRNTPPEHPSHRRQICHSRLNAGSAENKNAGV
jgi:hypothetical protein